MLFHPDLHNWYPLNGNANDLCGVDNLTDINSPTYETATAAIGSGLKSEYVNSITSRYARNAAIGANRIDSNLFTIFARIYQTTVVPPQGNIGVIYAQAKPATNSTNICLRMQALNASSCYLTCIIEGPTAGVYKQIYYAIASAAIINAKHSLGVSFDIANYTNSKLYLDGVVLASSYLVNGAPALTDYSVATIGNMATGSPATYTSPYPGTIDDNHIYNGYFMPPTDQRRVHYGFHPLTRS